MTTILSRGVVTLRSARSDNNLTVAELAQLAGISTSTIYNVERGITGHPVTYDAADALAKALDRSRVEIYWPVGLTTRNAVLVGTHPTHKGKDNGNLRSNLCSGCFTKLPRTGTCAYCTP